MKTKYYLWATVFSAITMILIAGLAHEVVFQKFFAQNTDAKHEGTVIIFIAYVILSTLMVYIYPYFPGGQKRLAQGFRFGALMGIIWVFPHGLAMAGAHGESISYEFFNGLWHMMEQGVGGLVIARVYSHMNMVK